MFVGIDVGGTNLKAGLVDQEGHLLAAARRPLSGFTGAENRLENAAFEYVQETIEQIARYLGLALKVLEVRRIAGLCDFAAENDAI